MNVFQGIPFTSGVLCIALVLGRCGIWSGFAAENAQFSPIHPTHLEVVTNAVLVTVTNYVVTTNMVSDSNTIFEGTRKGLFGRVHSRPLPALSWVPPADDYDWIQLKHGEWLNGRLKGMQNRSIEFFSEEFSDLSYDWKDIRQLRTHRTVDVLLLDGEKLSGLVLVKPTEVTVLGESPRSLSREQVESLTPGGVKERDHWSGNISLGLSLHEGNSQQATLNSQVYLERRTPGTRLSLNYLGNYSSASGVENANNHRVNSEFDLWFSQRFYLVLPAVEYYRDPFQNLEARVTANLGIGYDLIERHNLEWSLTTGPAYQYAWFDSSEPGEPTEKGTAALVFGTRFDWNITRNLEFILRYAGQFTSRQVGETTHHTVSTLSFKVTKRFDLNVSLTWDRISHPRVGSDGVMPRPDDFQLVSGLGVNF